MMHQRDRFVWRFGLASALFVVAVVSGCVQITPTPEPVTISMVATEGQQLYFESLLPAFQKENRHITVEFVRSQQFGFADADVFAIVPFAWRFMREEVDVLDLAPYITVDEKFNRDDFYPDTLDLFTVDLEEEGQTKLWAVPYALDMMVMYYDRALLDRYGVAYPQAEWTWDDFFQTTKAMYDPDAGIYGYAPDFELNDALAAIYQNGGTIFDDMLKPTRTTFDAPKTIEALDWYAKLMYEFNAVPTPQQARAAYGIGGYVQLGLERGRLGMWTGMFSEQGRWFQKDDWTIDWGMAPLPKGVQSATLGYVTGYAISTEAEYPDACWAWVSFLTRQIPQDGVPVRRSLLESKDLEDQLGKDVAATAHISAEHIVFMSPQLYDLYDALRLYQQAVDSIINGRATAQEAMTLAQRESKYK
ncbi:MAG: hypothetical protein JW934_15705 [Anaerolineae bacterium]|nr:hypothetical protein [Anaerolineae bacterium]